jgi:hypothetical protein
MLMKGHFDERNHLEERRWQMHRGGACPRWCGFCKEEKWERKEAKAQNGLRAAIKKWWKRLSCV